MRKTLLVEKTFTFNFTPKNFFLFNNGQSFSYGYEPKITNINTFTLLSPSEYQ